MTNFTLDEQIACVTRRKMWLQQIVKSTMAYCGDMDLIESDIVTLNAVLATLRRFERLQSAISDNLSGLNAIDDGAWDERTGDLVLKEDQWSAICTATRELRAALAGGEADLQSKPAQHASDCAVHRGPTYVAGPCDCGFERGLIERIEGILFEEHASDCAIHFTPPAECDCGPDCVRPAGFGIPPEDSDLATTRED